VSSDNTHHFLILTFWARVDISRKKWHPSVIIPIKLMVGWFLVFYATFNNISVISWLSVLLMEETREPGENH
jgi:hypothetical protein